jgi:hypothetical protein
VFPPVPVFSVGCARCHAESLEFPRRGAGQRTALLPIRGLLPHSKLSNTVCRVRLCDMNPWQLRIEWLRAASTPKLVRALENGVDRLVTGLIKFKRKTHVAVAAVRRLGGLSATLAVWV